MEKLKLHTPDLTEENVEKLAAIFPNSVTEGRDERGRLRRVVDFDLYIDPPYNPGLETI